MSTGDIVVVYAMSSVCKYLEEITIQVCALLHVHDTFTRCYRFYHFIHWLTEEVIIYLKYIHYYIALLPVHCCQSPKLHLYIILTYPAISWLPVDVNTDCVCW